MDDTTTDTPSKADTGTRKGQTYTKIAPYLYRANPSNVYYACKRVKGKLYRESLGTSDYQLAKGLLKTKLGEFEGRSPTIEGKMVFSALAGQWLKTKASLEAPTYRRYQDHVKQLCRYFGDVLIRNIDKNLIDQWKQKRLKEVSASTFSKDQKEFKGIMQFAVDHGIIGKNPLIGYKQVKGDKRHDHTPTDEEFTKLIETIKQQRQGNISAWFVECLAYSGARVSNIKNLTWGDVRFSTTEKMGSVFFKTSKNHTPYTIPLFPNLEKTLKEIKSTLAKSPEPTQCIFDIDNPKTAINNACTTAKLPHMHNHCFRHLFVTRAYEATRDFAIISKWVNHADGGALVIKTYNHLREKYAADMAKLM